MAYRKVDDHVTPRAVARMRKQGLSVFEISRRLGVSPGTVKNRLREVGALGPRTTEMARHVTPEVIQALQAEGQTIAEIADRLGVARSTIGAHIARAGLQRYPKSRRPDVTVERVLVALGRGLTMAQIAKEFGCSMTLLVQRLHDIPQ